MTNFSMTMSGPSVSYQQGWRIQFNLIEIKLVIYMRKTVLKYAAYICGKSLIYAEENNKICGTFI